MDMGFATNLVFWSNLFFIFPLLMSIRLNLYIYSALITVVTIVSMIYHSTSMIGINHLDTVLALILIASNLVILYMSKFATPYSIVTGIFVVVALFFYFTENPANYEINHTIWHIFSMLITLFCVIGYSSVK